MVTLRISCGETAGDVSLEEVECLCACDGAPVFSVNYENYERMTVEKLGPDCARWLAIGETA